MTTPPITDYPATIPDKGQSQSVFDANVDAFLTWLTETNVPEYQALIPWVEARRDEATAAALLAQGGAGLDLTGQGGNLIGVNAGATDVEFKAFSAFANSLLGSVDAAAARATLGADDASNLTTGTVDTARLDTGTTADKVVKLDGSARLPAVDGSQLTNLPEAPTDVTVISTTVVSSSVATVDLTFDSTLYTSVEIEFANVIPLFNSDFRARTSVDGGVTFDTGATDYAYKIYQIGEAQKTSTGSDYILLGEDVGGDSGDEGISGIIRIHGPSLTRDTFLGVRSTCYSANNVYEGYVGFAVRKSNAKVDGLRLYFSTGGVESGTIILRGYK